jgi:Spy/CpxP family protein refolding chaperone
MKKLKTILMAVGCVAALSLSAVNLAAQNGPPDPAQMKQRAVDSWRDRLDVKDDAEWKVLSDAIGKVVDARMEIGFGGFGGFGRGQRRGGDTNNAASDQGGQNRRQRGFGPPPSAEAESLQKSIDAKAPADEIKAKLAKLREANKAKEAKLESVQDELRKLLTSRQEAAAVVGGLLK